MELTVGYDKLICIRHGTILGTRALTLGGHASQIESGDRGEVEVEYLMDLSTTQTYVFMEAHNKNPISHF